MGGAFPQPSPPIFEPKTSLKASQGSKSPPQNGVKSLSAFTILPKKGAESLLGFKIPANGTKGLSGFKILSKQCRRLQNLPQKMCPKASQGSKSPPKCHQRPPRFQNSPQTPQYLHVPAGFNPPQQHRCRLQHQQQIRLSPAPNLNCSLPSLTSISAARSCPKNTLPINLPRRKTNTKAWM